MRLPVHIWIREANATPAEIAGYFTELARRLDEKPQKMRLTVESTVPATLDFDPLDGNPAVTVDGETATFCLRHRWSPEHPVPLELGPDSTRRMKRTTLLVDPVDSNRFRVRDRRLFSVPYWAYALAVAVGTVAAATTHPVAIGATVVLAVLIVVSHRLGK